MSAPTVYDVPGPGIRWRFPHQCAHWFGMTCSDGPPNSHLSVCWRKPASTLSHISIFFISYLFSTPPVECGEINCGNASRESAKKFPVENQKILHNRLWRKSACPVLLFSTFPHKIPLLRLLLQKPMILYIFLFLISSLL